MHSYARDDGLYDLEAELIDTKAYDFSTSRGMHAKGAPVHHMHLRLTIDDAFNVVEAQAAYDAAPYGDGCSSITDAYQNLVGLNLVHGFRNQVRARFGRTAGCTHMTELASVLPTVAIQTMARQHRTAPAAGADVRPFQLDGCHALRVDGPIVQSAYPRWYLVPEGGQPNDLPETDQADSVISPSSDS